VKNACNAPEFVLRRGMTGIVNMVFTSAGDDGNETLQFNPLRYEAVQPLPTSH